MLAKLNAQGECVGTKYFPSHLLNTRDDFLKWFVSVLFYVGFERVFCYMTVLHQMAE
jgi:hypothetical protein